MIIPDLDPDPRKTFRIRNPDIISKTPVMNDSTCGPLCRYGREEREGGVGHVAGGLQEAPGTVLLHGTKVPLQPSFRRPGTRFTSIRFYF